MMIRRVFKKGIQFFPWRGAVLLATGLILVGWLLNTPAGLLGKADAVGYAVCHRIDSRSFHLGDRQLPLCVRCSGMYLGALLGLFYLSFSDRRRGGLPAWPVMLLLGFFGLAFAVDGINSFMSLIPGMPVLYPTQNWSRLVTGTGMGLAIAVVLFPAFNQTVWRDWQPGHVLNSGWRVAGLVVLAVLLDLLVLSESPWVLYPLALVSAGGVLVILTMVYSMLWLIVLRFENRYQNVVQLGVALAAGFGTALAQIAVFDIIRYALTGTWDGFHLG
jgi:uncharacterized membrane protein